VLVGDPNQLPATVISQTASSFQYAQSLFQRLQKAGTQHSCANEWMALAHLRASPRVGHPVIMLDVQYRMHPLIREFPSNHFYDGRLVDGPNIGTRKHFRWHTSGSVPSPHRCGNCSPDVSKGGLYNQPYHADPNFQPFLFFDLPKSIEEIGTSFCPILGR
jgi:senataxin